MSVACPRCGQPLTPHQTKTALLQGCLSCGGIFVDRDGRNRVVSTGCSEVASASDLAAQHARVTPDTRARIQCPMCRTAMSTTRLAAGAVDIDVCDNHGAWFDRDELRRFIDALVAQRGLSAKGTKSSRKKGVAIAAGVGVAAVGAAGLAYAAQQQVAQNPSTAGDTIEVIADVAEVAVDAVDVVEVGFSVVSFFGEVLSGL